MAAFPILQKLQNVKIVVGKFDRPPAKCQRPAKPGDANIDHLMKHMGESTAR